MARRILVTGAAGLIGRELFQQLQQQDYDVTGVDNCSRFPEFVPSGNFVKSEILYYTKNNINDFDVIFHMAAINGTAAFYSDPNKVIKNNTLADMHIFDFVKTNKKTKLIYASSSEVIAGTNNFPTAEETDINIENLYNPRWSYRLAKLFSENYLVNSEIDYLILRYFNVYSKYSGNGHFVYDMAKKLTEGNFDIIGANETRSFCHVSDAVDSSIKIMNESKQIINIGSDEEILIEDAANIIADVMNIKPKWNYIDSLSGSVKRRLPDISKLRKIYPTYSPKCFKDCVKEIYGSA